MAKAAERPRLLLLLPRRGRRDWHDELAAALGESHDVTPAAGPRPAGEGDFHVVVDLSEQGAAMPGQVLRPLFDGSPRTRALAGRLQRGECPLLDIVDGNGAILASSYAAIGDSGRLEGRLALAFARVQALLLRALAGEGAPLADRPARTPVRFSAARQLKAKARRLAARLLRPVRRPGPVRHWNIALRQDDSPPDIRHFDLAAWRPLPVDPRVFHADPFVFERDGRTFLFAEAFPYAAAKGVIVCAELDGDGNAGPFRAVLERPWHLSYPYVFEHAGEIYLAPEGSTHGGVELCRATAFPWEWTLAHHVLPDWPLVDSTVFEHEGRLWLFASAASRGGSDWDELFAWHAPALDGPWTPHRLNPIKSDCRSARPGGRPLRIGGRLLRPAQRCEAFYGEALVWLEVRTLTPDSFEEVELSVWRAEGPGLSGPHGADLSARMKAIDYRTFLHPY
jgi:hypothetical protein